MKEKSSQKLMFEDECKRKTHCVVPKIIHTSSTEEIFP